MIKFKKIQIFQIKLMINIIKDKEDCKDQENKMKKKKE